MIISSQIYRYLIKIKFTGDFISDYWTDSPFTKILLQKTLLQLFLLQDFFQS